MCYVLVVSAKETNLNGIKVRRRVRINAFEMKCDRKFFKISETEDRTNKSIGKEFKMEDQWLEIFINKQMLKY